MSIKDPKFLCNNRIDPSLTRVGIWAVPARLIKLIGSGQNSLIRKCPWCSPALHAQIMGLLGPAQFFVQTIKYIFLFFKKKGLIGGDGSNVQGSAQYDNVSRRAWHGSRQDMGPITLIYNNFLIRIPIFCHIGNKSSSIYWPQEPGMSRQSSELKLRQIP